MNDFLPINKKEMLERGWQDVDFVFVTGDSYVDHPSFGVAILTRLLENKGYRVAVLSQPNWKNDGDLHSLAARVWPLWLQAVILILWWHIILRLKD